MKWWRKAAEQGHDFAQYNLGLMYHNGSLVPADDVAAYAWYSVAATSGFDYAPKKRDFIKRQLTNPQLEEGQVMAREIFERIEKRKAAGAAVRKTAWGKTVPVISFCRRLLVTLSVGVCQWLRCG